MAIRSDSMTDLAAQLQGIAQVLRNRKLSLPLYQRPYSWTNEQVQVFWNDLRSAFLLGNSNYYLGTLLLTAGSGARDYEVIDGQQRLTTTALLIAALRDAFLQSGDLTRSRALQNDYLTYTDLREGNIAPRLSLNSADNPIYESIASATEVPGNLAPSAHRLNNSYKLLKENLTKELEAAGDAWREKVVAWSEFLELNVKVIVLDVASTTDAFTIFETLNDRGLALSVADLLKNHIYSLAGIESEPIIESWNLMISNLSETSDEQNVLDYLRHFWSSWYGLMRERDLYRAFRTTITSQSSAKAIAENIGNESRNYLAIISGDPFLWPGEFVSKDEAEIFQILQMPICRPLLLAAMVNFRPEDLPRTIRLLVRFWIRSCVVEKTTQRTVDKLFADIAIRIRARKISSVDDLVSYLLTKGPSDDEFMYFFENSGAISTKMRRYMLLAILNYDRGAPTPEIVRLDQFAKFSLRKIFSEEEIRVDTEGSTSNFFRSFGNYEIEPSSLNRGSKNQEYLFDDRLQSFSLQSAKEDVAERQRRLATAARKVWKLEDFNG